MCHGLMQSTECYNAPLSHSGRNVTLNFHPGIQEYLAAKYLTGLPIGLMVDIFQSLVSMPVSIDLGKQLFDMWVFVFSTVSKPTKKILFSKAILRFDLVENTNLLSHQESLPCATHTEVKMVVDTYQADVKSINISSYQKIFQTQNLK